MNDIETAYGERISGWRDLARRRDPGPRTFYNYGLACLSRSDEPTRTPNRKLTLAVNGSAPHYGNDCRRFGWLWLVASLAVCSSRRRKNVESYEEIGGLHVNHLAVVVSDYIVGHSSGFAFFDQFARHRSAAAAVEKRPLSGAPAPTTPLAVTGVPAPPLGL
ncbi:hypothetical protein EVAR_22120_1 [Eumeta japonica]|uniref:Uncharacterized protein n=1 Tax=Eumeta variegata TaxID=151549 RepID=A0A4C1VY82_EUMVA|nr:hypothetical protein EVAR_22120_1 [Eumeta japonica]